jgi:hypothetical protein
MTSVTTAADATRDKALTTQRQSICILLLLLLLLLLLFGFKWVVNPVAAVMQYGTTNNINKYT